MKAYKYAGLKARTNSRNTGMTFESIINAVNNIYFQRGLGLIQKQYTPFIPLRDKQGKVVDVKVAEKSIVDYAGIYGRFAVAFEAKSCSEDRFNFNRIKSHQLDTLDYYSKLGHIAFLFLSFSEKEFYILPYPVLKAMITKESDIVTWGAFGDIIQPTGKYKYIAKKDINDFFRLKIANSGFNISFLDYMPAVIKIHTANI